MICAPSGFRFSAKEQSAVTRNILGDEDTFRAVYTLRNVCQSCLGPHGQCKLVHNGVGGHVTVTSSASRLLKSTQVTNPVLRLVSTAVQTHLDMHSDGGTMMATLTLLIIERALRLQINRRLITDVLDVVTKECIRYMNSNDCPARVSVSLDSLFDLACVVNGITSTKPAAGMTKADIGHINQCLVEAFLKTTPDKRETKKANADVQYVCVGGRRPAHSYVTNGLFIDSPQIPTCRTMPLAVRRVPDGARRGLVATVLYGVSMAGDAEDNLDVEFEVASDLSVDAVVLDEMLKIVGDLVERGVGLVVCQKVIHPEVKRHLRNRGVVVFDRLGLVQVKLLSRMVGGQLFASFRTPIDANGFGYVETIKHEVIGGRSYVRVEGAEEQLTTLVLCGLTEESLDELKVVCTTANHVLWQTVESGVALKGGGEWQRCLADHLRGLDCRAMSETLMCSLSELSIVLETVAGCFTEIFYAVRGRSVVDAVEVNVRPSENYFTPGVVLDCFVPALSAAKGAMFLAHMILGIKHFICDVN